jgi:hypothetical protein
LENFVAQPRQQLDIEKVERVQLQNRDSPKSAHNKSFTETRPEMEMSQKLPTSSSMRSHSAGNNGKKNC